MARIRRLWLATFNGKRLARSSAPRRDMRSSAPRRPLVNRDQVLKGQVDAFRAGSLDHTRPSVRRNTVPLAPLTNGPNISSELLRDHSRVAKLGENLIDALHHETHHLLDYRSSQGRITSPVTECPGTAKNRRMGRGTSPTKFKADFCDRLRSARVMSGLTQEEAAKALGMLPNTYSKYEKRTVIPSHLIPDVCDLFQIEERYLFRGEKANKERKSA